MSRAFLDALHADPWSEDFVDLATLNAAASDAIEDAIAKLRSTARVEPRALRSTSLVVLGSPGAGKTHLFARLRRRIGPRAVFVHIRPLVHAEMSPRFLLSEMVSQLAHATQGLPQISALVGSLLAHLSGAGAGFPTTFLETYEHQSESEREARLDAALERALEIWPDLDESYLGRLLRAPFAQGPTRRALLAWLSGRDCDVAQLQRIGATASMSEDVAALAIRTLATVAAPGAPIVLVFDQLENLVEAGATGSRLLAYAHLTSELVDTVRGLTLVHMALDTEWDRGIEPALNASQRSRLVMRRETLALPTAKEREELLRLWCARLPDVPEPFPWPLGEGRLARLKAQPGLTPRMLLLECRRALDGEPDAPQMALPTSSEKNEDNNEGLRGEWEGCLQRSRRRLNEAAEQRAAVDAARLADGLLSAGRFLNEAEISAEKQGRARLVLKTPQQSSQVAILAEAHPKSLGSVLSKLTTLAKKTAVVAIRERARALPPTWKDTLAKRRAFLAAGKTRWLDIDGEDCVNLLALDELLQAARSGDVTNPQGEAISEQVVVSWVMAEVNVGGWGIMTELLAQPSDAEGVEAEPIPAGTSEQAMLTLRRLRVSSVDRLVREVARVEPKATRASVLAELEGAGKRVGWFGRSIVCVKDAP